MSMGLSEFLEKYPDLKPIYCLLRHRLPPSDHIFVYSLSELPRFGFKPRVTVRASALPPDKLFFSEIPPTAYDFAHELIHLAEKPDSSIDEEVYAYNLAPIVLFCVRENIKADVLRLYTLTLDDMNSVLRRHGFKDIDDYFTLTGVILCTHEISYENGRIVARRDERYSDKDVLINLIAEISSGVEYFEYCHRILLDLLKLVPL